MRHPPDHRRRLCALLAALLASACAGPPEAADTARFRVVSYNVLVGFGDHRVGRPFHPGAERKRNITRFLAAERPDVVAFQEMNGYRQDRLRREAAAWGHRYAVLLKPQGYPTAVTSRFPIEVVERQLRGLHHGLLRVRTAGLDLVVVHLWPFRGAARLREVEAALAMYHRARAEGRPCLVLGDFNAVAASDLARWDATADARYRSWRWERHSDDRPRTDVLDACLAAGLVDLCQVHGALPARISEPRVDFILASPELARHSRGARWLAAPESLRDSDHPAVVVDLAWPPAGR